VLNYIVALAVILGGVVGYFISFGAQNIIAYLVPFAAGGFIYIASSDLIPELRKETNIKKSFLSFGIFLFGVLFMLVAKLIGE